VPQPCEILFVHASSYGEGTRPGKEPVLELPQGVNWKGRHVLVVEDIVDTGRTLKALLDVLKGEGVASLRVCAFLDKPARREVKVDVEFNGFTLEGAPFVVGYGLDFAGRYRNLPFIGTLKNDAQKR
jgi:hypoxanthine phosphoribosyltransferase